ncbi:MAG TPA: TolC family protein [Planctomycetota bacterium]|nr:TolC family protein [Planctomycetota bacterium]
MLVLALAAMVAAQERDGAPAAAGEAEGAGGTPGVPAREVTFEDAVELALAYNLGLKSARFDSLIARLDVEEQDALWDTTLNGAVGGGETRIPSRSQLEGATVLDTDTFSYSLGASKPFRIGPTLGIDWRTDRLFTNSSFSTINPSYDTSLEVSLTVPLLRGRGRTAQESNLRASQAGALGARYTLLSDAEMLIESVAVAYWNLVYLEDRVLVLKKSLEVAREIEEAEQKKLRPEIGRSTPLDVTKAHAETKTRETNLISGRLDAANASDDLRLLVLPFTGGPDDRIVLRTKERPEDPTEVPDLDKLVADALATRNDLRATDASIEQLREGVVQAQNQMRVQLDLTGTLTFRGVDGDISGASTQALGFDYPSGNAALNLSWPLGRRAAKAALHRAEIALEQAEVQRSDQVSNIIVEVRKAHRGLRAALEGILSLREEVVAADASLQGERKRLERGSSTVLDVAQLEEDLTNAQLRLLETRTKVEQARIRLERATGRLLPNFGIELGPEDEVQRRKP